MPRSHRSMRIKLDCPSCCLRYIVWELNCVYKNAVFISYYFSISTVLVADNIAERSRNINSYFTFSLYCNVCRSLFEKHKLLFTVLLSARILQSKGAINMVRSADAQKCSPIALCNLLNASNGRRTNDVDGTLYSCMLSFQITHTVLVETLNTAQSISHSIETND